ncbi:MAG: hypothetical protein ACK5LE_08945 [Alphaproteobacteria bacterium]
MKINHDITYKKANGSDIISLLKMWDRQSEAIDYEPLPIDSDYYSKRADAYYPNKDEGIYILQNSNGFGFGFCTLVYAQSQKGLMGSTLRVLDTKFNPLMMLGVEMIDADEVLSQFYMQIYAHHIICCLKKADFYNAENLKFQAEGYDVEPLKSIYKHLPIEIQSCIGSMNTHGLWMVWENLKGLNDLDIYEKKD